MLRLKLNHKKWVLLNHQKKLRLQQKTCKIWSASAEQDHTLPSQLLLWLKESEDYNNQALFIIIIKDF